MTTATETPAQALHRRKLITVCSDCDGIGRDEYDESDCRECRGRGVVDL